MLGHVQVDFMVQGVSDKLVKATAKRDFEVSFILPQELLRAKLSCTRTAHWCQETKNQC